MRVRLLLTLGIALVAADRSTLWAASTLTEVVERHARIVVASESRSVAGLSFRQGHLSLVLASGRAASVLAGKETVGFFFSGSGTLEYTSADSIERAVLINNVKKATGMRPEISSGSVKVRDEFQTALVLMAGREPVDMAGGAAPSLAPEFDAHRQRFLRDAGAPASHDFVLQSLDAPGRTLVRVELGGGEDLVHVFDAVLSRSEKLYTLRKIDSPDKDLKQFLWPIVLSEQPIERDRRDPLPSRLDLTDVALTLAASEGDQATLTVTETLVPRLADTSLLRLELYNQSYAWKKHGSVVPRRYNLRRVLDAAGAPLPFVHEHDDLLVGLPAPSPRDRPIRLVFEIDGPLLIRPHGHSYWVLGTEPWFPQPDLAGQSYTFRATVKVKKPFVPFASGRTVSRRLEGDVNVLETELDKPDRFPIVMAGSYQFEEETRDGLTVRVASYAGKNDIAIRQLTDLAFGIIKFYEPFLGPFPFSELNIIEINDYGWGQAPPATVFITKEAFDSRIDALAWLYTEGINERFAHEIAHQYWGHAVFWPNEEEQWLSEGFAEYCAALFVKEAMGKVEYNALLATWKTNARLASDVSTIATANRIESPLDPYDAFRKRNFLLYHKGAWLLSRLHAELGDQVFLTFLKSYQKSFRGKAGTTKHVAGLLQFMTKKDYMPFFEANYWGLGMPK